MMDSQMQQANTNNQPTSVRQGQDYPKIQPPILSPTPIWRSRRILVSAVMFLCFLSMTFLRWNMVLAVAQMTAPKRVLYLYGMAVEKADFDWDEDTVKKIKDRSIVAPLFAILAIGTIKSLGGSRSYTIYAAICGTITLLHPMFLLHFDVKYVFVLRWLLRFFETLTYISISEIFSQWFPTHERCRLISYSYTGFIIGTMISPALLGYLIFTYGWQISFTITGSAIIATSLLCMICAKNPPSQDSPVSPQELSYIRRPNNRVSKVFELLKNIILCRPFWALCVAQFAYNWIDDSILTTLHSYIRDFSRKTSNGSISEWSFVVSYIAQLFAVPIIGTSMDYCKIKMGITITNIHKFITCVVFILMTALFVTLTVALDYKVFVIFTPAVILFILPIIGLMIQINAVSIAPNHSHLIAGLSSAFIPLGGFASSKALEFIIQNHSLNEWRAVFLSESVVCVLGAVTFLLFGSSESQL